MGDAAALHGMKQGERMPCGVGLHKIKISSPAISVEDESHCQAYRLVSRLYCILYFESRGYYEWLRCVDRFIIGIDINTMIFYSLSVKYN